eukprot:TRINITY_DN2084_c0_g1_i1.p1 TRINITY_DN2084_c0_g1~~TRINITY_DN2084_c0_g1_i1.p1  ORF type:complete len:374 (+),score=86.46 TRINITY_DN2084_c0_g1_i1:138-1259(+)
MASSTSELNRLATSITCHAWNGDRSKIALCPNDNTVHIYAKTGATYNLEQVLEQHDQVVTGIDWAPKTDRIVTSSQDRNAYVWKKVDNVWKPTLVILRINRAATHVKWSPSENKFAVASGAKCVSVCYFEEENDWWVSKHIKKHKSTVLKVDWHPNNVLLVTGSSDFKARVFSAYIKDVDGKPVQTPFGTKTPFGDLFSEIDAPGWIHSVKWSPSGNKIAFAGHDSSINFADITSNPPNVQRIRLPLLPFRDLLFLSEKSVVAVGEDANPCLFTSNDSGEWTFISEMDKKDTAAAGPAKDSARDIFTRKDTLGTDNANDTKVNTQHQNCITCIAPVSTAADKVTDFSTSGLDGSLVVWHTKALEAKLKNLKIV